MNERWRIALIACGIVFLALVGLFWPTVEGMVSTWYHYETYTHGFIILPISLWLIWHKRHHLARYVPQPTPVFLVFTAVGILAWVLARLVGVQIIEQLAFVGLIIVTVASILGWQTFTFLAFPLLFLFFAVPIGDDLVPPMMEFTADFTVAAVELSGIPVYREGLWFSLPTGDWSVVEACSGVRYLIASVTLGFMYAYITYHTLWKRLLFIAMSAVVPIFANGLRAYMIVMIGHLSDMEYATGVDHLIYGWFFFGIVMFILFWFGSLWQEEEAAPEVVVPRRAISGDSAKSTTLLIVLLTIAGAGAAAWITHRAETANVEMAGELTAPKLAGEWRLMDEKLPWLPNLRPTSQKIQARYTDGKSEIQLFVALFPQQQQGMEAINSDNTISFATQRISDVGEVVANFDGGSFKVNRSRLLFGKAGTELTDIYYWQWYRIAGRPLINRYEGKAWEALSRFYPGRADGAWIAVTTDAKDLELDAADDRIRRFTQSAIPLINAEIDRVLGIDR